MGEDRRKVLKMLKDGTISVDEAEALLDALGEEPGDIPLDEPSAGGDRGGSTGSGAGGSVSGQAGSKEERAGSSSAGSTADDTSAWRERTEWSSWAHGCPSFGREIARAMRAAMRTAHEGVGPSIREALRGMRRGVEDRDRRFSSAWFVRDLFGSASASELVTLLHPVPGAGRLVIRNPRGDVRIGRSPDREVHVSARKQAWGRDEAAAREALGRVQIRLAPAASDLVLAVEPAAWEPWRFRFRVDIDIDVPPDLPVTTTVASGDVRVRDLASDLDASIRSGDLDVDAPVRAVRSDLKSGVARIRQARSCTLRVMRGDVRLGSVEADTDVCVARGDVRFDSVGGDLRAEITHGHLRAGRTAGTARVRIVHGGAWIGSSTGDVDARIESGDLDVGVAGSRSVVMRVTSGDATMRVTGTAPDARLDADVVFGNIDVTLAPEVRAVLIAEARTGRVDCGVPLRDATRSRGRVEGVYGEAHAAISASTVSGTITIKEIGESAAGTAV